MTAIHGLQAVIVHSLAIPISHKVKITLRPTSNRPVGLGVKPHVGFKTRFLLLSDCCGFVDVGRPL
jgi:hypothetical protein